MELRYIYYKGVDKYFLYSLCIKDIDDKYRDIANYDSRIESIVINKTKFFDEMYVINLLDKHKSLISSHYISKTRLNEATLKELINFEKPIILTADSKCEYIEKISNDEFNFVCEDYGKLINLRFDGFQTLSYFKNNNIIYVYDNFDSDTHFDIKVDNYSEKHNIISGYGIISEYWNTKHRCGSFTPLYKDLSLVHMNEYNTKVESEYDVIPYYFKTYFTYKFSNNDSVAINTINTEIGHHNKIYYDGLIPELSEFNWNGKREFVVTKRDLIIKPGNSDIKELDLNIEVI